MGGGLLKTGGAEVVQNKEEDVSFFLQPLAESGLSPLGYIPVGLRPKAANGVMSISRDNPLGEDTLCLLGPPKPQRWEGWRTVLVLVKTWEINAQCVNMGESLA